jgi:hypothetical protein
LHNLETELTFSSSARSVGSTTLSHLILYLRCLGSSESSAVTLTRRGSIPSRSKLLSLFRKMLYPTAPCIQCVQGASPQEVKRKGHEVDHSSHPAPGLRMSGAVTPFPHTPLCFTDKFTFYNFNYFISQPH